MAHIFKRHPNKKRPVEIFSTGRSQRNYLKPYAFW